MKLQSVRREMCVLGDACRAVYKVLLCTIAPHGAGETDGSDEQTKCGYRSASLKLFLLKRRKNPSKRKIFRKG